jgi:NAD(P)-dependent dehydrogenase (short-subunit alcohol dehydrogenase family)
MRKPVAQVFETGDAIDVRPLDVTDPASIQACVASVVEDHGRIDVLINNAGIHLQGAIEDMQDASFRRVFETNFFGAVNLARAVLPAMRRQGTGRIICVSSIGAQVGRVMDGAYCASKAALEIAFEAMHHEVARFGVKVSVVCPGAFQTGIGDKFESEGAAEGDSPYRELLAFRVEKVREAIAGGGNPQEVAELIKKVADDPAPQYRYVVGEKAIQLEKTLAGMNDEERRQLITQLAGIGWWQTGAKPSLE